LGISFIYFLFRLLVRTALADKEGQLCSFPEFASRMKVSHTVHPIARMAAWVNMIWTAKLKLRSDDVHLTSLLKCLTRLQVADQAKFPHIVGEGLPQDLSHCEVFSKPGDFADLMWLVDAINHGYSSLSFPSFLAFSTKKGKTKQNKNLKI
jgi:hypothetical protein